MTSLKAVIFDFDGVLADSVPVYREAVVEALGDAGVDNSDTEQIIVSDTRTVARRIIEKFGLDVDVETMAGQIEKFALDRLLSVPRVVPGARGLVGSIRKAGLKTAVASLAPRHNIDAVLAQAKMQESFEAIVTIEDIIRIKPDPEVYLKAAEALGVYGAECIAIEDSDLGVTAAIEAGMVTVGLTTSLPAERLRRAHHIARRLTNLTLEKLRSIHLAATG